MNRLIKCIGNVAKEPYQIRNINMDIYSIEELCYFLCEYTDLIDGDLMDDGLIAWVDGLCGLTDLAAALGRIRLENGPLADYVSVILQHTGYAPSDRIEQIREMLRQDEKLSIYERKKKRADNLTAEKKYSYALDIYLQLLYEIPKEESRLRADVLYNCGVVYARLFYYEIAQEFFVRAYALCADPQIRQAYLFCKRRMLSKQEYINYNADHPDYYEDSLALERSIGEMEKQWEQTAERKELDALFAQQNEKNYRNDSAGIDEQIKQWEKEFGVMVRLS